MANSKFLEYQDKDNSGLIDACDELANVPTEPACPPCQKNPRYIVPDWKTKNVDEPWLNERTCRFQITIVTNETRLIPIDNNSSITSDDEANAYVEELFKKYKKEAAAGLIEYFERDPTQVDTVAEALEYDKYDLDFRPSSKVKLLYSTEYDILANLPDDPADPAESDEEDEESEEDGDDTSSFREVTYVGDELVFQLMKVRKALNLYSKYLDVFRATQKGNMIFSADNRVFYLERYGDNGVTNTGTLKKIIDDIEEFLNHKGYKLRGAANWFGATWAKGYQIVDTISFRISSDYTLKRITITTSQCAEKEFVFGPKKIKSLTKKGHFKDKTAMAYLLQVSNMVESLEAREPMGWIEFITTFTYPSVIETFNWPSTSLTAETTPESCVGEALLSEGKQMLTDILDVDFNLTDTLTYLFGKQSCKQDLTALRAEQAGLNLTFDASFPSTTRPNDRIGQLAKQQAFQQLQLEGGEFFSACARLFSARSGGFGSRISDSFDSFFNRIKLCGLQDLALDSMKCLMAGLTLEESLSKICKSALESMSMDNFGRLFVMLDPAVQQGIQTRVIDRLREGDMFNSFSQGETISNAIENDASVNPNSVNIRPWIGYWEPVPWVSPSSRGRPWYYGVLETRGVPAANSGTIATSYTDAAVNATATDTMVMSLYVQELLNFMADDLLALIDLLNRFPGAQLIVQTLFLFDCPRPPILHPSMLDYINDIEIPLCRSIDDLRLPHLANPLAFLPSLRDVGGAVALSINLALQEVLVSVLTRLMVKICNLLSSAKCKSIEIAGKLVADAINPTEIADLSSIIRESICGQDASEEQVQDTILEMMETLGVGSAALAEPSTLMSFASDMSANLTRSEMMNMFLGRPTPEGCRVIKSLIEDEYPQYEAALPSEEAVCSFFGGIGKLMPADVRNGMSDFLDTLGVDDQYPANPTLCADPEQLERFCSQRAILLHGRASISQSEAMCGNEQEEWGDLLEMASTAAQDPQQAISDALPPLLSQPGCEDGIVPSEPESVKFAANQALSIAMSQLHESFSKDMIGNGLGEANWGLLNMILSDTLGRPLTAHHRKAFNDNNYVNFVTEANTGGVLPTEGQYPAYVAEWLRSQLGSLSAVVTTNNMFLDQEIITRTFEQLKIDDLYAPVDMISLPDFGSGTYPVVKSADEVVEFVRVGRKATPDLTLEFTDNNKGLRTELDNQFSYGFEVRVFLSELFDDDGTVKNFASDNVRLNIVELLNNSAIEITDQMADMSEDQKSTFMSTSRTAAVQANRLFEFSGTDRSIQVVELENYPLFQQSFESTQTHIPQLILLHEMMSVNNEFAEIPSMDSLKETYDSILSLITNSLKSNIQNNESAFLYGAKYEDLTSEDVEYVVSAGQTDSAAGTPYAEATIDGRSITNDDAILGVSLDQINNGANARVVFLDPAQYGGSYVNPPVYIKPQRQEGWYGIVDLLFPELSPCKPSLTDLVDFSDIGQVIQDTYNRTPMDERLLQTAECAVEKPYNRILERMGVANIQGLILAACRIYASTHFIKSLATFTTFKPDFDNVYSSIYGQYIVENMETAFKDAQDGFSEFFNPFKDEEFWYSFLEQSVQTYGRMLDQGTIVDPPPHVMEAISILNGMQRAYDYPSRQDWWNSLDLRSDYDAIRSAVGNPFTRGAQIPGLRATVETFKALRGFETYKNFKNRLNLEAVKATEDSAKVVLGELVKRELHLMAERFMENLKEIDVSPSYNDIDYYLLTQFTQGGIGLELDKEIVEQEASTPSGPSHGTTSNVANHTHVYEVDEDGNGWAYEAYNPLDRRIFHKHKITGWSVELSQSGCYPNCKDLYGFDGVSSHDHYISNMIVPIGDIEALGHEFTDDEERPFVIEKYVSLNGRRYAPDEASDIIKQNDPIANLSDIYPGTLELVYPPGEIILGDGTSAATRELPNTDADPIGVKGELGVKNGLQFSIIVDGVKYELASVEMDALDYEVQQFLPVQANSKELLCLLKMLKEEESFKLISRYILPTNKLLSVMAIYNDLGFLPSIGETTVAAGAYHTSTFLDRPGIQVTFDDSGIPQYSYVEGWASGIDRKSATSLFVREWDDWDQVLLRNSKRTIKNLFKSYYNSRDFNDDMEQLMALDPVKFNIMEMKNRLRPSLGKTLLPKWRRKNIRSNPFDSKGELCEK